MKDFLKCRKCPYKLGEVKCKTSPCPQCIASGRKKPPFQLSVNIKETNLLKNKLRSTKSVILLNYGRMKISDGCPDD